MNGSDQTQPALLVLIPIYRLPLTASEYYSIQRTCEVLASWKIAFLCPHRLRVQLSEMDWPHSDLQFIYWADEFFESVDSYNILLMSPEFYKSLLSYEFLLIAQTDALVISDQLGYWCKQNWSFIGAPWFKGFDKDKEDYCIGVGNGGFSLRNVRHCLQALECYSVASLSFKFLRHPVRFIRDFWIRARKRWILLPNYNEDYFFGVLAHWACPEFRVPSPAEALPFAFEAKPRKAFEMNGHRLPFGCHAFEKYDLSFWRAHISELKDVIDH